MVVVKLNIDDEFWSELEKKFPEIRGIPKATAIRVLLNKLLEVEK